MLDVFRDTGISTASPVELEERLRAALGGIDFTGMSLPSPLAAPKPDPLQLLQISVNAG